MSCYLLQRKAVARNKFYRVILVVLLLGFSGLMVYSFIEGIIDGGVSSLFILDNTFMALPVLLIFFTFLSFEICYKMNAYAEVICVTPKGKKQVYFNQLRVVLNYAALMYAEAVFFNVLYILVNNQFFISLIIYTVIILTVYFLLCIISAAFIGLMLSVIKYRVISYIIIILLAIAETGLTDSLSFRVYDLYGINISKAINFFNIVPVDTGWTPNMLSGYMVAFDAVALMLLFIFLSIAVFCMAAYKSGIKRAVRAGTAIVLCAVMLAVYIMPFSSPQMNIGASGASQDAMYYERHGQYGKEADFRVLGYDLDFAFLNQMYALASVSVDNNMLEEYNFTLYHGYKVKKVTDDTGEKINFIQKGDALSIYPDSGFGYLNIYYSGGCNKYYGNYASVFLPGNFAFYPLPGIKEIYSTSNYAGFVDSSLNYDVDFNIKVNTANRVYCNLEGNERNKFKGRASSLTLLSGYIKEASVNNCVVYYPYFDSEYTGDSVKMYLVDFTEGNDEIKKIFIIPNINLETIEGTVVFNNYMVTSSMFGIEEAAFMAKMSSEKMNIYMDVSRYPENAEYLLWMAEFEEDGESAEILRLLSEVLDDDTDGSKRKEIYAYLADKNDNRSFSEVMNGLK